MQVKFTGLQILILSYSSRNWDPWGSSTFISIITNSTTIQALNSPHKITYKNGALNKKNRHFKFLAKSVIKFFYCIFLWLVEKFSKISGKFSNQHES